MGVAIDVQGLTKSFGSARIWEDVTMTIPEGEVSVLLGPSGTGKSVFLKSLIGLLRPERGSIVIDGTDILQCSAKELYEIRTLFGVLFQDGALFGSMNIYDNTAFPLREHTKKSEKEIRDIVMEKLELVGMPNDGYKFPGEISGGMRKRAGLARALVLDPQIILCDEPDSGLDPVRTAYLSQLLIDINAQIDATILIVTHNINIARTVPDNMGMLFRKQLVMFGPREVLLTSEEPVVRQFLNGRRIGPIGMSEEKDQATAAAEEAMMAAGQSDGGVEEVFGVPPQLSATPGMPERKAVARRKARVREILHTLPPNAQAAIRDELEGTHKYAVHEFPEADEAPTASLQTPPG
ncbi:ABC transporter ATP-binding protein [Mycolicibacter kumamotonensis]|jgi:phospholipid/cholesterol/gamma-HCH transport system ATP-binding protein|uniref:ABC transporter ATP-binding protein n=1 Tax=Mycolicibacter kumamotonensis TaxID=354243 RepID=A0A1B8SGB6_9MYCO|nr:ABC transporter ATP-binding protein [Mycolicibacter kumamotonensis]NDJ87601.1 ABC transporter ATP-binding protein [Mycolicibacter kumamotonensis]OBY31765.1 ABC transporter ATP-binding protein [Mycolicibacter kumamotonensis]ORA81036.1 ABC transporter ATP-binding protein [Mycolicibacter kumamotonensis]